MRSYRACLQLFRDPKPEEIIAEKPGPVQNTKPKEERVPLDSSSFV